MTKYHRLSDLKNRNLFLSIYHASNSICAIFEGNAVLIFLIGKLTVSSFGCPKR